MKQNILLEGIIGEVRKVIIGKDECIRMALASVLAGGHILIEDVPGVGKTTIAMAFSKAMALDNCRVQFTPDVLPADILGFSMYQKDTGTFQYQPGTIMCNLFLADEINRTSPKTQSALLEVMEEGMVTVDGVSRPVPEPFIVIATQNPVGSAGTQVLPESQLDRFMISMSMGYPDLEQEIAIAKGKSVSANVEEVRQVITGRDLMALREEVEKIAVHDAIFRYMGNLVHATRKHEMVELGISPRGMIALTRMAKGMAFLHGRAYATPEDVVEVFPSVAKHRLVLGAKARIAHVYPEDVVEQILAEVEKPVARKRLL